MHWSFEWPTGFGSVFQDLAQANWLKHSREENKGFYHANIRSRPRVGSIAAHQYCRSRSKLLQAC
ncbi:MAG: hypothetical protein DWI00_06195 [Planctomycetota bacterium]|nr:MAG: hypothetical protein DWI00_06195 [Planctomycetota bacterium]